LRAFQHSELTDDELIARYRDSGNNEWLGYLLQRYTMLLLGVALKYLKDRATAEDAVQQVFLKTLTHLPQGEIGNFKGWLYVLTRNHCLQVLRDRQYQLPDERLLDIASAESARGELEWKDYSLDQMNQALDQLQEGQRNTIILFYLKKMSYQQIMDATGYSYLQVKSFIQNGKRNLKMILIKKLGDTHL